MIDLIYIADIAILFIVLGYRGRINGMLPESFFCVATIVSGFAAFLNQFWLAPALISILPMVDAVIIKAVTFVVLYVLIRVGLATIGLQMFTQLRTTPFKEPVNKVMGIFFSVIKSAFIASAAIYGLEYLAPIFPLFTDPIKGNSLVSFFYDFIPNTYSAIFSLFI